MWKDVPHVQGHLVIARDSGQGSGLGTPGGLLEYEYSHSHGLDGGDKRTNGGCDKKNIIRVLTTSLWAWYFSQWRKNNHIV